jgi:prepilin-type N-terminal cleavage/methylation domain-containing protein
MIMEHPHLTESPFLSGKFSGFRQSPNRTTSLRVVTSTPYSSKESIMDRRMSKLKLQRGFTLVEVIVVAVIVAVLAGVSIPLYNGYVDNSRANAAANAAGSAASFLGACYQSQGTPDALAATATSFPVAPGDGEAEDREITCNIPGAATNPSFIVPAGYILRRIENAVHGRHNSIAAAPGTPGTGGESAPYSFPAPAADAPAEEPTED